jgi:hypothetical protein
LEAHSLTLANNVVNMSTSSSRAHGFSVRCVKSEL